MRCDVPAALEERFGIIEIVAEVLPGFRDGCEDAEHVMAIPFDNRLEVKGDEGIVFQD